MYLTKLNSDYKVRVNILNKKINWDKAPSKNQLILQKFLQKYWGDNIVCAEWYIPGSKCRIDIINFTKRIVVEYSPESHHVNYNKFFHKNRHNFHRALMRDYEKSLWCEKNGFALLELNEKDIDNLSVKYLTEKFGINIV